MIPKRDKSKLYPCLERAELVLFRLCLPLGRDCDPPKQMSFFYTKSASRDPMYCYCNELCFYRQLLTIAVRATHVRTAARAPTSATLIPVNASPVIKEPTAKMVSNTRCG